MRRRGEMQAVELLDAAAAPEADPRVEAVARRAPRRRWRRWFVAGAAALAVTLVGAQVVIDARERAAIARLAALPGVLDPVDASLDVVRRMSETEMRELYGTGGSIRLGPDGSQSFTWRNPDSARWTTELLGPSPALSDPNAAFLSGCIPDIGPSNPASAARRVVCLVTDSTVISDGTDRPTTVPATVRRVVVLSAADGSVEAQWPLEHGRGLALLPDGLVVVASMNAGASVATAYDLLTGEERWTHRQPLPADSRITEDDPYAVGVYRAGDLVALSSSSRSLLLLSAQGRVVRDVRLDSEDGYGGWRPDPLTGGLVVLERSAAGVSKSTLIAADGDPTKDVALDGEILAPSVDDGSVPGLRLSIDAALHAWDSTGRSELWWHDTSRSGARPYAPGIERALVVRGRVYLTVGSTVTALDGTTGATLWSTESEDWLDINFLMTDGHHILVSLEASSSVAEPALVAYDPVSGREAFRAVYPDGVTRLVPADRQLVGYGDDATDYVLLD